MFWHVNFVSSVDHWFRWSLKTDGDATVLSCSFVDLKFFAIFEWHIWNSQISSALKVNSRWQILNSL